MRDYIITQSQEFHVMHYCATMHFKIRFISLTKICILMFKNETSGECNEQDVLRRTKVNNVPQTRPRVQTPFYLGVCNSKRNQVYASK